MLRQCYLALAVVAASLLTLSAGQCATDWLYAEETQMCYRGLQFERMNYTDAQKRCNELRSNLFQFNPGDTKKIFEDLQDTLHRQYKTTEFRTASWIGLTDLAEVGKYVYLNNFTLSAIAPNTLISCPDAVPNCKPQHRCVYLDLDRRGTSKKQVFSGNCAALMPAICYAPVNGTDQFDRVPALGASSAAASAAVLLLAGGIFAGFKSLLRC